MNLSQKEALFKREIVTRFELFSSLFLTLPFYQIKDTGTLLPFFNSHCEEGVKQQLSPEEIIESFFSQYKRYIQPTDQFDLLFRIIRYVERQVVLFDAIEDAAFKKMHDAEDLSSLEVLLKQVSEPKEQERIKERLQAFSFRLVLTAHPTQFYPGPVLAIINDLTQALKTNDINTIAQLLHQLGKTPFFKKAKPTPLDEAVSLAWFLENVFYQTASAIQWRMEEILEAPLFNNHQLIELGFWPGGDRDGNPNVTVESTKSVFIWLRQILFRCYYRDFRVLKRRITFRGVEKQINRLQTLLYENSFYEVEEPTNIKHELIGQLQEIKHTLYQEHDGLFVGIVEDLIRKVNLFGCYFASIDIRQDSKILHATYQYVYNRLSSNGLLKKQDDGHAACLTLGSWLPQELDFICPDDADSLSKDLLHTIRLMKKMQEAGGEKASHRFIISNCHQASDMLHVVSLFLWSGWQSKQLRIDFVPLFETVQDLSTAAKTMESLYQNPYYMAHLKQRGNRQDIMLGFSDSTKDGGYLMANWSIYKAKMELTNVARQYRIKVAFFDGRGGPPARGGGKTQRFYASMGREIANDHIQLTIQGQTISSQYGSLDTAYYNMQQLIHAGLTSFLRKDAQGTLKENEKEIINKMAQHSYGVFVSLREHPLFLPYLKELSPLKFLSEVNISSRPVQRGPAKELKLEDLRAISFVTSWSQLKQNIPGFYGVGSALEHMKKQGLWDAVKHLYQSSDQFKAIIDNCMMSMTKSDFAITAYIRQNKKFGHFWQNLKEEFDRTERLILELSDEKVLMEKYPMERKSIAIREKIVLPLVVIQHYAIQKIKSVAGEKALADTCRKLVIRTIYGIVNAGRNLA